MDERSQVALMGALERLYDSALVQTAWPAAFDAKKSGRTIPNEEIEVVVLPLARLGAPTGDSDVRVFIAYYSHPRSATGPCLLASPPLVVKIGQHDKLKHELDVVRTWPTLASSISSHLALPLHLDGHDPAAAVLIAPFQSQYTPTNDGRRHGVILKDLWKLLHDPEELLMNSSWSTVARHVAHALETMNHVHRNNLAEYTRQTATYRTAYDWYLRDTHVAGGKPGFRQHIPRMTFGDDDEVVAFGKTWRNPCRVISDLINDVSFEGVFGPVHGDLHPKNIVLGYGNVAHIIDFGWARTNQHVIVDYALLDVNMRGITLPSQMSEAHALMMGQFIDPRQDPLDLPPVLRERAKLIKEQIWQRLDEKALVENWRSEYLIPFFILAYGLLVYLDSARNQPALIASILAAGHRIWETA